MPEPVLLRVPERLRSVDHVLGVATRMGLDNVLVLSIRENGELVFLAPDDMTLGNINWMLDRMKMAMLESQQGRGANDT